MRAPIAVVFLVLLAGCATYGKNDPQYKYYSRIQISEEKDFIGNRWLKNDPPPGGTRRREKEKIATYQNRSRLAFSAW